MQNANPSRSPTFDRLGTDFAQIRRFDGPFSPGEGPYRCERVSVTIVLARTATDRREGVKLAQNLRALTKIRVVSTFVDHIWWETVRMLVNFRQGSGSFLVPRP